MSPGHTIPMDARQETSPELLDIFVGPLLQYLMPVTDADDECCLIKTVVPSGVTVPIHSHADREIFYILSGELQGMTKGQWRAYHTGDVFDVPGGIRHAIRNTSGESMTLLLVTTMKLGRFFREVGRPTTSVPLPPPTPADLQRFGDVVHRYGYWMGDSEDNAAVGIVG
jgi:quercetin dioxygenase-like cupin family protein